MALPTELHLEIMQHLTAKEICSNYLATDQAMPVAVIKQLYQKLELYQFNVGLNGIARCSCGNEWTVKKLYNIKQNEQFGLYWCERCEGNYCKQCVGKCGCGGCGYTSCKKCLDKARYECSKCGARTARCCVKSCQFAIDNKYCQECLATVDHLCENCKCLESKFPRDGTKICIPWVAVDGRIMNNVWLETDPKKLTKWGPFQPGTLMTNSENGCVLKIVGQMANGRLVAQNGWKRFPDDDAWQFSTSFTGWGALETCNKDSLQNRLYNWVILAANS